MNDHVDIFEAEKRRHAKAEAWKVEHPDKTGNEIKAMVDHITELAAQAVERRKKLDKWLLTQPQFTTCKVHGLKTNLDPEESSRMSHAKKTFTAQYKPCPRCSYAQNSPDAWLLKAGVPMELMASTLENWKAKTLADKDHMVIIRRFVARRVGFLILEGPVGLGKSHLAVACLKLWRKGLFIKHEAALQKLRKSYGDDRIRSVVEQCQNAELLVLDELGLSTGGRDELPMLNSILDHRHAEFKPTILTTNLKLTEINSALGERMADRLRQAAFAHIVLRGQSWRQDSREDYLARAEERRKQKL